ncbi:hypothetical protein HPB51_009562 [Rhipicephalus microplus]|uniref:Uncharacterized protein n=1 Tax=Rhipicephalus microplus TaxID=6941 RepID=A0A9J6E0D3_RHIMP|nr:hypothetical protein HPB51_009562 [Rhipicephalus microplus]
MARSVRGASAAAAGRGVRFPSAPSDYRFCCLHCRRVTVWKSVCFCTGIWKKRPYRLEDFRAPLEEVGLIKSIIGIGALQMNHIWLAKMRSKVDKEALLKTGGLRVKGGFCAIIDPIQHDVTVKIHWVDFAVSNESIRQVLGSYARVTKTVLPTDDAQDNLMDAEEAEKLAPGSNAVGPDAAV